MDAFALLDLPPALVPDAAPPGLFEAAAVLATALLLVGVPMWAVELASLRRRGGLTRGRVAGMATSLFTLAPFTAAQMLGAGGQATVMAGAWALAPAPLPITPWTALLALVAVDLAYYADHRVSHEVGALWAAYHGLHHSADHFDQTVGARLSFLDPLLNLPSLALHAALVLAGLHPALVLTAYALVLAWQQWIHTETVGALPWLDGWLNTPANHRVHHASNPAYLDRNLGGILMVWDRLFGTYAPEIEPVTYGLTHPLGSHHPGPVHFALLGRWWRHVRAATSLTEAARRAVEPPAAWESPAATERAA